MESQKKKRKCISGPTVNIMIAVKNNDRKAFLHIFNNHKNDIDVNYQDEYGYTLLMYAIDVKNRAIFDCLLTDDRVDVNLTSPIHDCSALHVCVLGDDFYFIEKLLRHKNINPNIKYAPKGNTVLMHAFTKDAMLVKQDTLTILINNERININAQNNNGETALHLAYKSRYSKYAIKSILQREDVDVNLCNNYGFTPLMYALRSLRFVVYIFFRNKNVDVNAVNCYNETALDIAIRNDNLHAARLLIENGAAVKVDKIGTRYITNTAYTVLDHWKEWLPTWSPQNHRWFPVDVQQRVETTALVIQRRFAKYVPKEIRWMILIKVVELWKHE